MAGRSPHGSLHAKSILELNEALSASLNLHEVLKTAFPLLAKLVPTDYGSICVSRSDQPGDYDWLTVDFPVDWFSAYPEMAPHDFVRKAVVREPNSVLRDCDMISRRELESNMMYQRARDLKVPLEHVMSVLVDFNAGWHAGISLYRGQRAPFSEEERAILQELTPMFANAIRNCKTFCVLSRRASLIDAILRQSGVEAVVFDANRVEVARTDGVASLIARWFGSEKLDRAGLPVSLMDHLAKAMQRGESVALPLSTWIKLDSCGMELSVSCSPIPGEPSSKCWMLRFAERHLLPERWRSILTPREQEVASRVVLGWDNTLIAEDLRCEPATVKKHMQRIFDKLAVSNRASLCHVAVRSR
jgi:DNA-binding CsgD family transcriptional regulator